MKDTIHWSRLHTFGLTNSLVVWLIRKSIPKVPWRVTWFSDSQISYCCRHLSGSCTTHWSEVTLPQWVKNICQGILHVDARAFPMSS